jgi:predicted membrane metal-binding protein
MAIVLSLLFLLAQIHTLLWNIGIKLNANVFISFTLGGLLMSFALIFDDMWKRIKNETKGDITFSERYDLNSVRAVSLTFKVIGIIAILGAFFPRYSVWFVVVPLMFSPFLIALFVSIKS